MNKKHNSRRLCYKQQLETSQGHIIEQEHMKNPSGLTFDAVEVFSVSTKLTQLDFQREGSIEGGTMLFIKAAGLDQTASNNKIWVGPYECLIPGKKYFFEQQIQEKGVNEVFIKCMTTRAFDPRRRKNLPVEIFVMNKMQSKCGKGVFCTFTYKDDVTPELRIIFPASQNPTKTINLYGQYFVSTTADFSLFQIGDYNCERFTIFDGLNNLNDNEAINGNVYQNIDCNLSEDIPAGLYNTTILNSRGQPINHIQSYQTLANRKTYQVMVLPQIKQISQQIASTSGSELKISGDGFGDDLTNVQVTAGGLPCQVQSINNNQISCKVDAGSTTAPDDSKVNQFIGGSGAKYDMYDISSQYRDINTFRSTLKGDINALKGQNPDLLIESGVMHGLELSWSDRSTGLHIYGYFKAPVTGTYNFMQAYDDRMEFWLSSQPGNADRSLLVKETSSCDRMNFPRDYWTKNNACNEFRTRDIVLVKDELYYFEVFQIDTAGSGHFLLGVEVTSNEFEEAGKYWNNFVPEIQQIRLSSNFKGEKWSIKVNKHPLDNAFGFMFYRQNDDGTMLIERYTPQKVLLAWDTATFCAEMHKVSNNFGCVGYAYDLDNEGNRLGGDIYWDKWENNTNNNPSPEAVPTYNASLVTGKEWVFRFERYRPSGKWGQPPQVFSKSMNSGNRVVKQLDTQSAPIRGGFKLSFMGQTIYSGQYESFGDIAYNRNGNDMTKTFTRSLQSWSIKAQHWGNSDDGLAYNIFLFGITNYDDTANNHQIPLIEVLENNLTGGEDIPTITISRYQAQKNKPFFEPIQGNMLYTHAAEPQVLVSVTQDNLFSTCRLADCSFVTDILLDIVLTNTNLAFGFTAGTDLTALTYTVMYAGVECISSSCDDVTNAISCTCTIPTNSDATPLVESGNHIPQILFQNRGYAKLHAGLIPESINLVLSSYNPTSGNINGGVIVTISGTGLPADLKSATANNFKVLFDNLPATILTCSNIQVTVEIPSHAQGTIKLQLTMNGQETDITGSNGDFEYNTVGVPTVSSVSLPSASPVLKQQFTVTGTEFGTDRDQLKLYLKHPNNTIAYELFIVSSTNTEILSTLSGGSSGDYKVVVWKNGIGNSIGDIDFQYRIFIDSIDITTGSDLGGTLITLTGRNFCLQRVDNAVFFSHEDSDTHVRCVVQESTTTQIKCISPPLPAQDDSLDIRTFGVYMQGKLIEEAQCATTCQFTYDSALTPQSTPFASNQLDLIVGNSVSVTGTGFSLGPKVNIIFKDTVTGTTVSLIETTPSSDTSFSFTTPNTLVAGSYLMLFQVVGIGYAGAESINIVLHCGSISPQTSISGGNEFIITGSGFDPSAVKITMGDLVTKIRSVTNTQIVVRLPKDRSSNPKNQLLTIYNTNTRFSVQCDTISYSGEIVIPTFTPTTVQDVSSFTITFTSAGDLSSSVVTAYLELQTAPRSEWTGTLTGYNIAFSNVPAGTYSLFIHVENEGYAHIEQSNVFTVQMTGTTSGQIQSSFAGGSILTLNSIGFDTSDGGLNKILVCGFECQISSVTSSQLQCAVPELQAVLLQNQMGKNTKPSIIKQEDYTLFADNMDTVQLVTDNQQTTYYQGGTATQCYFGFDFGEDVRFSLTSATVQPKLDGIFDVLQYENAVFQGSDDQTTWSNLFTLGSDMALGKNYYPPGFGLGNGKIKRIMSDIIQIEDTQYHFDAYRYIRLFNQNDTGNAVCTIAEVELSGHLYYKTIIDSATNDVNCDVKIDINGQVSTLTEKVVYSNVITSIVTQIQPIFGWQLGGDTITITGLNFGTDPNVVTVMLDGVECVINNIQADQIDCVTGNKPLENTQMNMISVTVNGYYAIIQDQVHFYYGLLWSLELTWGGESKPRPGDTVFIPAGTTLIVDESTPINLFTVINEGNMIFADNKDLTFDTWVWINRMGRLIIGTEQRPYQHKLVITMYGHISHSQLPEFGNKGIGCHHCTLDIHGTPKTPTWTFIAATVSIGSNTLSTTEITNWEIGDHLVLASTGFDHREAEEIVITAINGNNITFTPALKFRHFSDVETYDGQQIFMRAELGCLTRNIVIQGDPNDSQKDKYGAHLMIHGKASEGSLARIEQAEFRQVGQPKILGRYPIHFHMNGDVSFSYVRGNAIHDSHARCTTIHAVFGLRVQNNVCYKAQGHNIFLEDGIEEGNLIEYNLIVSSRFASNMLQTDTSVASIWITNPNNIVRFNHVAGSDFYGMWYEIKERPDGPSATNTVCPQGNVIGEFNGNVAHSNTRFGFRTFVMSARQYPCKPHRDDSLEDPFSANPALELLFQNFTTYKNGESGVLAEEHGYSTFDGFKIVDSFRTGFQMHLSNFTKEEVTLVNSIIVGRSQGNADPLQLHANQRSSGVLTPRTDGFRINNTKFFNFGAGMVIIEHSSENQNKKLWVQGGKQTNIENVQLTNSADSDLVRWRGGAKTNIVFDKGGSLSGTFTDTYITPYYKYFEKPVVDGHCTKSVDQATDKYDNSVICTGKRLRRMIFRNFERRDQFIALDMRIQLVTTDIYDSTVNPATVDLLPEFKIKNPKADAKHSYVAVFPVGYMYNIHWLDGVDFTHVLMVPSYYSEPDDENIIFRFNHTKPRELFESSFMVTKKINPILNGIIGNRADLFTNEATGLIKQDPTTCVNGQFHHDPEQKLVFLCHNSNTKTNKFESIVLDGIFCREYCPKPGQSCTKETFDRYWNNHDIWSLLPLRKLPNENEYSTGVPQPGDDVFIPCEWNLVFNVATHRFGTLVIDGLFKISNTLATTKIEANNIWVKGGEFRIGTQTVPHIGNVHIELYGTREGQYQFIDNNAQAHTKTIMVTQEFKIYGQIPATVSTRMTANSAPGTNTIQVQSVTDWKAGDELAIGPSGFDAEGWEKATIQSIDETTKIVTLTSNLQFFHYGNIKPTITSGNSGIHTIGNTYGGSLDMRAAVGLLTRNIKITGTNEDSLGGSIFVYHWLKKTGDVEQDVDYRGSIILQGVETNNMGQKNGQDGAIHFFSTNKITENGYQVSEIKGCAIHDCDGMCFNAEQAWHIKLLNNVIYRGQQFLIKSIDFKYQIIQNNLLIGALMRNNPQDTGLWDPVASIYMYSAYDYVDGQVLVTDNVAQGSEGEGFSFPAIPCEHKDIYGFKRNTVGNVKLVGVVFTSIGNICWYSGEVGVYAAVKEVIITAKKTIHGIQAAHIITAECKTNLVLRVGTGLQKVNNNWISDSWFSGMAREGCTDCYLNSKKLCTNNFGLQLMVSNNNGESEPRQKNPLSYDVLCVPTSLHQSMYVTDVKFHNYRASYPGYDCGNNFAFHSNIASSDASAGHYMNRVTCDSCDETHYFRLEEPQVAWRGWFGGCGTLDCTGPENVLIEDQDGSLFGAPTSVIAMNEPIGDHIDSCTASVAGNFYKCTDMDFAITEWTAIGEDLQKIIPVPIQLTNDQFTNTINIWREWAWNGAEPKNLRLNFYYGLVKLNQVHNLTYGSSQSVDLMYRLQQKQVGGDASKWIIFKNQYNTPLAILVIVNQEKVKSFPPLKWQDLVQHSSICGANNYYYENRTIHFVINGDQECSVRVKLLNFVRISLRLSMTPEAFIQSDDAQTQFIDRIAAFLSISTDRIRIVRIISYTRRFRILQSGGTQVEFQILELVDTKDPLQVDGVIQSSPTYTPNTIYKELNLQAAKLNQGFSDQQVDLGLSDFGIDAKFQSMDSDIVVVKDMANPTDDQLFTDVDLTPPQDSTSPTSPDGGNTTNAGTDNNANQNENPVISPVSQQEVESNNEVLIGVAVAVSVVVALVAYVAIRIINQKKKQALAVKPDEFEDEGIQKVYKGSNLRQSDLIIDQASDSQGLKNSKEHDFFKVAQDSLDGSRLQESNIQYKEEPQEIRMINEPRQGRRKSRRAYQVEQI